MPRWAKHISQFCNNQPCWLHTWRSTCELCEAYTLWSLRHGLQNIITIHSPPGCRRKSWPTMKFMSNWLGWPGGPANSILMYQGYEINSYTFYTRAQDNKSTNQNSGVCIDATDSSGQRTDILVTLKRSGNSTMGHWRSLYFVDNGLNWQEKVSISTSTEWQR